jgi:5S rRNA maturation endonuclease (ribonuclease M5)
MNLVDILRNAGCKPTNHGTYITCAGKYRGGDDPTSVAVYPQTGTVHDFVTSKTMSIEEFLKKTLNLKSQDQLNKILSGTKEYYSSCFAEQDNDDPFNKTTKYYSSDDMLSLEWDHSYWNGRNISDQTVTAFQGGVCKSGKMENRYVFPIFNSRKKIEGFSGRDITGKSKIKWKHIGKKSDWAYPLYFSHKYVTEHDEIILVESIGDMLSLWQCGIRNIAITFGTDIGSGLLKAVLRLDPKKIIIATNNDENQAGQKAAQKIKSKLIEFFDESQIQIYHPTKNDFGEQTSEENLQWYNNIKI